MELTDIHLGVLLITVIAIVYSDYLGLAYMRGKKETLSVSKVVLLHRFIWVGIILMILTGIVLISSSWEYWLQNPVFYIKMGFVCILIINSIFIGKLSHIATEQSFASLETEQKSVLLLSGALSVIGWIGSISVSFFL